MMSSQLIATGLASLRFSLLAVVSVAGFASLAWSLPQGDTTLPDGTDVDPDGMGYSTDEMLDEIGDTWGSEAQSDTADSIQGAVVGELPDTVERYGDHDDDTIGVQTEVGGKKVSKTQAAARLKHEARHRKSAKNKNKKTDPVTQGLCGSSEEARREDAVSTVL